jgi:hypothetical protein
MDAVDDDLRALREALAARIDMCWARLEDAVSELVALHNVPIDSIADRVAQVAAGEQRDEAVPPARQPGVR